MLHRSCFLALVLPVAVGQLSAQAVSARITGIVYDSVRHAPMRNALVVATPFFAARDTVFHSAQTDGKGRFDIASLTPGEYSLSVEHAYLDSTSIPVPAVRISAHAGDNSVS